MLSVLDTLRDLTELSIAVRLLCAMICGGLIGLEREFKRRPAGFRTHILICMGAAIATLTSQFLLLRMHYYTDVSRLGAQVIAGIGFIGAGSIIVTGHHRVKGLTTAAGLWTTAIVGLCCGAGFYEGALAATALVLLAELVFSQLEYRMLQNARNVTLHVEYTDSSVLDAVFQFFRTDDSRIVDLKITRLTEADSRAFCVLTLQISKQTDCAQLLSALAALPGIISVEEL
jgi:putative Mg2+ transporter-C (MgtC) family protein